MENESYEDLDPGIRETVKWLQANNFNTTDSGDGKSKFEPGNEMDFALAFPHVAMIVGVNDLIAEADRLVLLLESVGLDLEASVEVEGQEMPLITVEATYSAIPQVGLLMLTGVDDAMLAKVMGAK